LCQDYFILQQKAPACAHMFPRLHVLLLVAGTAADTHPRQLHIGLGSSTGEVNRELDRHDLHIETGRRDARLASSVSGGGLPKIGSGHKQANEHVEPLRHRGLGALHNGSEGAVAAVRDDGFEQRESETKASVTVVHPVAAEGSSAFSSGSAPKLTEHGTIGSRMADGTVSGAPPLQRMLPSRWRVTLTPLVDFAAEQDETVGQGFRSQSSLLRTKAEQSHHANQTSAGEEGLAQEHGPHSSPLLELGGLHLHMTRMVILVMAFVLLMASAAFLYSCKVAVDADRRLAHAATPRPTIAHLVERVKLGT